MSKEPDPRLRQLLAEKVAQICGPDVRVGDFEFESDSFRIVRKTGEGTAEEEPLKRIPRFWVEQGFWDEIGEALRRACEGLR